MDSTTTHGCMHASDANVKTLVCKKKPTTIPSHPISIQYMQIMNKPHPSHLIYTKKLREQGDKKEREREA
jgi:hypothetical protein